MAETLNDAVLKLRLDTKDAKKDAEALRDRDGTQRPGPSRPTPSSGGGRQGGGGSGAGGSSKPLFPPGSTVHFDPGSKTVTVTDGAPPPGVSGGSPQPPPGQGRPDYAPIPRVGSEDRSSERLRRRVNRVEAQQAVGTLASGLAGIPFAEVAAVGLAGAALAERFGPGIGAGAAEAIRQNTSDPTALLIARGLEEADAKIESLSGVVSEIQSAFAALSAARQAVGAAAKIRELAGADADIGELAEIGIAEAKVARQLSKLRNRGDYIEREALGKAMSNGALNEVFKLSMGK